jgi:two-component system, cell cycle sensor histidine kinase and response regulator CckA
MGGRAVADTLSAQRPGLAVVFMSGFTGDVILRQRLTEGVPFLVKPFTVAQLVALVRQVLDARPR